MTILSPLAPSPVDEPPGPPDAPPVEEPPPVGEPPPLDDPPRPDESPPIRARRQRTTSERIGVSGRSGRRRPAAA